MSWTAPKTWTTGEVVDAADLNAELRDNLLETAPAKVTTAGDVIYATGANALSRLAIGTAGKVLVAGASAPTWNTTAGLVGRTTYNPGTAGSATTSSATYADVDATNLTVTFTGVTAVIVRLGGYLEASTTSVDPAWNLRDSGGDITGTACQLADSFAIAQRMTMTVYVSGLTASTSYTYKWGHANLSASGNAVTRYGGTYGPAVMEVWAA